MPRRCTVCDHPHSHGTDQALGSGTPYPSVAKWSRLSSTRLAASAKSAHETRTPPTHTARVDLDHELEAGGEADTAKEIVHAGVIPGNLAGWGRVAVNGHNAAQLSGTARAVRRPLRQRTGCVGHTILPTLPSAAAWPQGPAAAKAVGRLPTSKSSSKSWQQASSLV